jgi:D-alanine-D-alanine ligase
MARHDCIVLYNAANLSKAEGSQEEIYPSTILREEVGAVEESLRAGGFNPYVLGVEQFSRELVQTIGKISPRFVFNLCEEINGKCDLEMCVAGLLDLMEIPYTGCGPLALGLALNKFRVKLILRAAGIPSARGCLLPPGKASLPGRVKFPVIAKPVQTDASLGINSQSVCRDVAQLEKQVAYIHNVYRQDALIEEYLDGREFNVSVIGDRTPEVLAISEIDFRGMPDGEPRIVSYRAKWDEESAVYGCTVPICPAEISKRLQHRIRDLALRSYQCTDCRDYARVDMRTDARGNVYVLEVNPNPDISPQAGFARAARAAGYTYDEIILRISRAAMERSSKVALEVHAF